DIYIPGMGLAIAVLLITTVGYLLPLRRIRRMVRIFELPLNNIPVGKTIYSSVKCYAVHCPPGGGSQGTQPVLLPHLPGQPVELVGLVTRHGVDDLPECFTKGNRVAVYLPMGYMIGGYTLFVPGEWVQPIEMSVEEAMRSSLIAWMSRATPPSKP